MESSIEKVIATYTTTVYGVALTHTASRADADDVFQEVFAAYWRSKPACSSSEHLKAWLIRTTLNFSLKTTQSSWAKKTVYVEGENRPNLEAGSSDSYEPPSELPSTDFPFQSEQQTALYNALGTLSVSYRTVVLLFYFEDLPIAQIAEILGEEQGTVKTRLSRARAQLREMLKEGV